MADMSPRKSMAMGDGMSSGGDFGVPAMSAGHIPCEKPSGKALGGHERAGGKPVKHAANKLPKPGDVDHGPHGLVGRGSGA